jgi:Histone methylation protein DOT1
MLSRHKNCYEVSFNSSIVTAISAVAAAVSSLLTVCTITAGTSTLRKRCCISAASTDTFSIDQCSHTLQVRDKTLAYAEMDLPLLTVMLRIAKPTAGERFFDLGSGMGKALLATAALHPELAECTGVELLPGMHKDVSLCSLHAFSSMHSSFYQ